MSSERHFFFFYKEYSSHTKDTGGILIFVVASFWVEMYKRLPPARIGTSGKIAVPVTVPSTWPYYSTTIIVFFTPLFRSIKRNSSSRGRSLNYNGGA